MFRMQWNRKTNEYDMFYHNEKVGAVINEDFAQRLRKINSILEMTDEGLEKAEYRQNVSTIDQMNRRGL